MDGDGISPAEGLNEHWFLDIHDARTKIEAWRLDYNEVRRTVRRLTLPRRSIHQPCDSQLESTSSPLDDEPGCPLITARDAVQVGCCQ